MKLLPEFSSNETLGERISKSFTAIKIFYIRRAFRILPLALVWLSIYYLLSIVFYDQSVTSNIFGSPPLVLKEIAGFLSGMYNYLISYGLSGNSISHYWSLSVEEQFYLVLPLLFILSITIKKRVLSSMAIVLSLIVFLPFIVTIVPGLKFLKIIFAQRYFSLLFGVLIALLTTNRKEDKKLKNTSFVNYLQETGSNYLFLLGKIISRIYRPVVVLSLIFVLWSLPGLASDEFSYNSGYVALGLIASALVFLAQLEKGWILNIPVIKNLLQYIGTRSYCVYLSHFAFIHLNQTILSNKAFKLPNFIMNETSGSILQLIFVWAIMLLFAELFYRVLEEPFINLGKAYISFKYKVDFDRFRKGKGGEARNSSLR